MKTYRPYIGRHVNVIVRDLTIAGILTNVTADALVLTEAAGLTDGEHRPIDGTVIVPSFTIEWVQVDN
jgi:hypothetical protein